MRCVKMFLLIGVAVSMGGVAFAQTGSTPHPAPTAKQPFYLPESPRSGSVCNYTNAPGPDEALTKESGPNVLSGGQRSTRGRGYVVQCATASVSGLCRSLGYKSALLLSANGKAELPNYENRRIIVTLESASAACFE